jgi:hypothetical protein
MPLQEEFFSRDIEEAHKKELEVSGVKFEFEYLIVV